MLVKKDLFIKEISIEKNEIDNYNIYPFDIDLVKNFEKLNLSSPVTFFIGENGIGKSTFIEAIAIKCGLNPEGGT